MVGIITFWQLFPLVKVKPFKAVISFRLAEVLHAGSTRRKLPRSHARGEFKRDLASYWPTLGPSWDGLAILSTTLPTSCPVVILVEAKSHAPEVYGNGSQAGATSRDLIEKSLGAAKRWCGAQEDADWMGALYQSANRLAHLYFIRERLRQAAWLVNLYFTDDPYRPTSLDNWRHEVETVKKALGLTKQVPGAIDLFLPALALVEPSGPVALALAKSKAAGDLENESSVCADGADVFKIRSLCLSQFFATSYSGRFAENSYT